MKIGAGSFSVEASASELSAVSMGPWGFVAYFLLWAAYSGVAGRLLSKISVAQWLTEVAFPVLCVAFLAAGIILVVLECQRAGAARQKAAEKAAADAADRARLHEQAQGIVNLLSDMGLRLSQMDRAGCDISAAAATLTQLDGAATSLRQEFAPVRG